MESRFKAAELKSEKHVTQAREAYNTLYVAATRAKLRCKGYGRILEPVPEATGPMTQEEALKYTQGMRRGDDTFEPS